MKRTEVLKGYTKSKVATLLKPLVSSIRADAGDYKDYIHEDRFAEHVHEVLQGKPLPVEGGRFPIDRDQESDSVNGPLSGKGLSRTMKGASGTALEAGIDASETVDALGLDHSAFNHTEEEISFYYTFEERHTKQHMKGMSSAVLDVLVLVLQMAGVARASGAAGNAVKAICRAQSRRYFDLLWSLLSQIRYVTSNYDRATVLFRFLKELWDSFGGRALMSSFFSHLHWYDFLVQTTVVGFAFSGWFASDGATFAAELCTLSPRMTQVVANVDRMLKTSGGSEEERKNNLVQGSTPLGSEQETLWITETLGPVATIKKIGWNLGKQSKPTTSIYTDRNLHAKRDDTLSVWGNPSCNGHWKVSSCQVQKKRNRIVSYEYTINSDLGVEESTDLTVGGNIAFVSSRIAY